jgi:hypothetical protein
MMKGDFMVSREALKRDIDMLPNEALEDLQRYIFMQKFYFDAFDNDTDYLNSIPGMAEKIISGMQEPLCESIVADEVDW